MKKNSELIADDIIDIMCNKCADDTDVKDWISSNKYAGDIVDRLSDEDILNQSIADFNRKDKKENFKNFIKITHQRRRRKIVVSITSIAAALVTISILVYNFGSDNTLVSESIKLIETPTIITSEGNSLDITEYENINTKEIIAKYQDKDIEEEDGVIAKMSRLIVPKKFTSKITLDDGTIVHLNSNSELEFPTEFNDDKRIVKLKGEAYFEVAKSEKIFIVNLDSVDIKVYGTQFNVNANDDKYIEIVLIDGVIGVATSHEEILLSPNEMCSVSENKKMEKTAVDTRKYVAWKDGLFMFEKNALEKVLNKLSTWYDIDFKYNKEDIQDIYITTIFSNKKDVIEIIQTIEMLNINIKFIKIEGGYEIIKFR